MPSIAKGILTPGRTQLSFAQRVKMNQLIAQGVAEQTARQLAIALEKSAQPRSVQLLKAAQAAVRLRKGDFDESKHPRAENGRFGEGGGDSKDSGGKSAADHVAEAKEHAAEAERHYMAQLGYRDTGNSAKVAEHEAKQKEANAKSDESYKQAREAMGRERAAADAAAAAKQQYLLTASHEENAAEYEAQAKEVMADYRPGNTADSHKFAKAEELKGRADARSMTARQESNDGKPMTAADHGRWVRFYEKGKSNGGRNHSRGAADEHRKMQESAKASKAGGSRASRVKKHVAAALEAVLVNKADYHRAFVTAAKDLLPGLYFDKLHASARGAAGGKASGQARSAAGDDTKAELLQQKRDLRAALSEVETQLSKSAPQASEVYVDALLAGGKKKKTPAQIAAAALAKARQTAPAGKEYVDVQIDSRIVKTANAQTNQDWKRLVTSVVYAPDEFDTDGDYMTHDDIEKAAHHALKEGLYMNIEHAGSAVDASLVESYVAPVGFDLTGPDGADHHVPKGAWVQTWQLGQEIWRSVLDGTVRGFSLEGTALRDVI